MSTTRRNVRHFVIATFLAFLLFPLTVVLARSFAGVVAALVGLVWERRPSLPFYSPLIEHAG